MQAAIDRVTDLRPPSGRGLLGWLAPRLRYIPILRAHRRPRYRNPAQVIAALRFKP